MISKSALIAFLALSFALTPARAGKEPPLYAICTVKEKLTYRTVATPLFTLTEQAISDWSSRQFLLSETKVNGLGSYHVNDVQGQFADQMKLLEWADAQHAGCAYSPDKVALLAWAKEMRANGMQYGDVDTERLKDWRAKPYSEAYPKIVAAEPLIF